jgi:site-specific DNA-methyltransferase (adenine-specific)
MLALERGSVDMVLCDLPSGETNARFDKPVSLPLFWTACSHCLKRSGTVAIMASSFRFAAEVYESQRKFFRYDLIWSKSTATGFFNSKKMPLRSHEFVLIFCLGKSFTYNPQMVETGVPIAKNSTRGRAHGENYGPKDNCAGISRVGATDRFPRSVWEINSLGVRHPERTHPQQKPEELFQRLILTHSNPGEIVVDPCAGSGTTERAAFSTGRRSLCWDIEERFARRPGAQMRIGEQT